jgi:hypothetical protein
VTSALWLDRLQRLPWSTQRIAFFNTLDPL